MYKLTLMDQGQNLVQIYIDGFREQHTNLH